MVLPDGVAVLNGNDPMVAEMAPLCDGEVIFFGANQMSPAIDEHLRRENVRCLCATAIVVLATGDEEVRLVEMSGIMLAGPECRATNRKCAGGGWSGLGARHCHWN